MGSDEMSSLLNNSLIQDSEVTAGYPSALATGTWDAPRGEHAHAGNYEQIRNSACHSVGKEKPGHTVGTIRWEWEHSNSKSESIRKKNQDQSTTQPKLLEQSADVETWIKT
ncbi:hypothetical protein V500_10545 [Pseudogymnoascus sp. VKM F-4518 (FW-2643)]|nr:hypothetical protein V500_10545 [Pseudogymnoascus sp. VKM F-4518 (FW-2643)]